MPRRFEREPVTNLLTGAIRARDQASFSQADNVTGVTTGAFAAAYRAPLAGDLAVVGDVSAWIGGAASHALVSDDDCARRRRSGSRGAGSAAPTSSHAPRRDESEAQQTHSG